MTLSGRSLPTALVLLLALGCSGGAALITDEAGVLTQEQHDKMNALLLAHRERGPGRISVLIVEKLPAGTSIEKLAATRINQPPPAADKKLDRVLLAIALQDRRMRIETSKEVWALLPDSFCEAVIEKTIAPQFKEKNYFEGIREGVSALIKKLAPTN